VSAVLATLPRTLPAVVQALETAKAQFRALEIDTGMTEADMAYLDRLDAHIVSLEAEVDAKVLALTGVSFARLTGARS